MQISCQVRASLTPLAALDQLKADQGESLMGLITYTNFCNSNFNDCRNEDAG